MVMDRIAYEADQVKFAGSGACVGGGGVRGVLVGAGAGRWAVDCSVVVQPRRYGACGGFVAVLNAPCPCPAPAPTPLTRLLAAVEPDQEALRAKLEAARARLSKVEVARDLKLKIRYSAASQPSRFGRGERDARGSCWRRRRR